MKRLLSFFFVGICCLLSCHAQFHVVTDAELTALIKGSEKKYRLLYIFCDYCKPSIERFPKVVEWADLNKEVELFVICAQDAGEVNAYLQKYPVKAKFYLINSNRKRRAISFYNPIKAACKYLTKELGIPTDKMRASALCALDKEGKLLMQTSWEMNDEEYFEALWSVGRSNNGVSK